MPAFSSRSRFIVGAFLLSTCFLTLLGCKEPAESSVTGIVKLDNEPLTNATVYFVCSDGQPRACNVKLDGSYEVKNVPFGTAMIKVVTYQPPAGLAPKGAAVKILPKYNDEKTSGLTLEVTQAQTIHDIPLSR